jgi:hypothetical protein
MKDTYFKRYSEGSCVGKWKGWIEVDGKCLAFVDVDDKITWMDDLEVSASAENPPELAESEAPGT